MRHTISVLFLAATFAFAGTPALAQETVTGLQKANPQPSAESLKPGLGVTYYHHKFNDTREIPEWAKYKKGHKGEPIPMLDYFVGDGEVLTSGRVDSQRIFFRSSSESLSPSSSASSISISL